MDKPASSVRRLRGSVVASGIPCPECQHLLSMVKDSRPSKTSIRRRRECEKCKARYTTVEQTLERQTHSVIGNRFVADVLEQSALALIEAASVLKDPSKSHYLGRSEVLMRQSKKFRGVDVEKDMI